MTPGRRAPVQQLLIGHKPNRPLDSLMMLKDKTKQVIIWEIITALDLEIEPHISSDTRKDLDSALVAYQAQSSRNQQCAPLTSSGFN